MRIILTLALICGLVACQELSPGVLASSQQQGSSSGVRQNPRPPSKWWKTPRYVQELKLTAEQSAEIDQIVQASMARWNSDKEDLDRAQSDFRALMERPTASQRDLVKAAERLEMARYSIAKERTMTTVRIHSVLTPEQRKVLSAIAKRHEAERNRQNQQK
jgi:Spy/CpxP family protein refolding chaperone